MSMRKMKITMILLAIVAFCTAIYFFIITFSRPENAFKYPAPPMIQLSPTPSTTSAPTQTDQTPTQTTFCGHEQLSGTLSAQGAAGNIYAKIELTNIGKTSCAVILGNSVYSMIDEKNVFPKNIVDHYMQKVNEETFSLAPGAKVYSQIHYPNGPQCQQGITPKRISFAYTPDLDLITFVPDAHSENLIIQACSSDTEKTTIDIWPLSKTPITQ